MKRIHHRTLGMYSQLWGYQLNSLNGTRLVGSRLTTVTPSVDTNSKFRNFYSSSTNLFSNQILPSSSTEPRIPSTTTSATKSRVSELEEATTTEITEDNKVDAGKNLEEVESESSSPDKNSLDNKSGNADELEKGIFGAKEVETLLALHGQKGLSMNLKNLCQIVFRLGLLVKKSSSGEAEQSQRNAIISSEKFNQICGVLQSAHFEHDPTSLLIAIQGLMNIGVASDSHVLQALENEMKWVFRRCSIRLIARAVGTFTSPGSDIPLIKASKTKLNSSHPLIVAVYALQRRWVEITTGSEFIAVFQVSSYLTDETRTKLEDRAIELVQEFTPMEMVKIFIALGHQKRRPTPLLRTLAFHLSKSTDKFSAKDMIELIYALNALNFADPVLMGRLCNDLHPEIESINNSALVSSLVTSLGQLRYKHTVLLAAVEEWIMKHLDELRPFDAAAWLLTCSVLNVNVNTDNVHKFCSKAKQLLESTKLTNPVGWVNIVHALTVLNQVDADILATSLDPKFITQINDLGERKNVVGVKSKLLNLNAVSKIMKEYKGPSLSPEILAKWSPGVILSTDEKLSISVLETLSNFLPPPKYFLANQKLPSGVFVDAVCKLNKKLDPIPVDTIEGADAIKVAVVVQGYPSLTLGLKEPTGPSNLNVRLLENDGYTVVTVPCTEFHPQEKLLRKVQYLEQRMRSIQLPSLSQSISSSKHIKDTKGGSQKFNSDR